MLDLAMPGMNGKEVCKRLKNKDETKHIPVVFLTGSATAADVVECYDVGADYYLNKPIRPDVLIKQIEMTFQEKNI